MKRKYKRAKFSWFEIPGDFYDLTKGVVISRKTGKKRKMTKKDLEYAFS